MPATFNNGKKRLFFNSIGVILEFAFWLLVLFITHAVAALINMFGNLP